MENTNLTLPEIFNFEFCEKHGLAPIMADGRVAKILVNQRTDLNILSYIKFYLVYDFEIEVDHRGKIEELIKESYANLGSHEEDTARLSNLQHDLSDQVVELVDSVISQAIELGASDIHFEPFSTSMSVRFRLDGFLNEHHQIDKELVPAVISRIKIISGLDIAEKRRPQDGRIRFGFKNRTVDIRVSILPTDFGEKAVLRLLDKHRLRLDLSGLGFESNDLAAFREKLKLPNGIILITGPTGSGKTTTLYAALSYLKSPRLNITTIEDPIEYNLEGINQTQIKPQIGLTFGSALRSILRQDPNIIMVGEIRDQETLDNALRASITGHLVLSTVHTNDAISTITRLTDLGSDLNLLQTSIKIIIAQRLVRLICPSCKSNEISEEEIAAAKSLGMTDMTKVYQGRGCNKCLGIGYWGRSAIYEMLNIDGAGAEEIYGNKSYHGKLKALKQLGFETLREKGLRMIYNGLTSPTEILRETI